MKKIVFIFLLGFTSPAWGQTDTLMEENLRKAADLIFQNLDSRYYGPSLLNRSFSSSEVILEQVNGNYDQIHTLVEFLEMYQDVAFSYVDSTYMMNIPELASYIDSVFYSYELSEIQNLTEDNALIQPFGFVYHNISYIDSSNWNLSNFDVDSFSYVALSDEQILYNLKTLKSCGILEFSWDSGYESAYLKYEEKLISVSPDITNVYLSIDLGGGFQDFNTENDLIEYERSEDSLIGRLAIQFDIDETRYLDTLFFYITTRTEPDPELRNLFSNWDDVDTYWVSESGVRLKYGVKWGCGNSKKEFKRPIIIVPPYRPKIQSVSLNKYYNQFNYAGLIDQLSDIGYDVIFLKLIPGNNSLEDASEVLRYFITYVNDQKGQAYSNESWENILIGYSMGGQIARYTLKKMEYEHMTNNKPHHHTRLYIPFDSPHQGANIPMFTQFVYRDLDGLSFFAHQAYKSLTDEASKDMGICHINGSSFVEYFYSSGFNTNVTVRRYTPGITYERLLFLEGLNNWYNHEFTPLDDLRRMYPTFTRNIAVSVGRNDEDYDNEFDLSRGMLLFHQDELGFGLLGLGLHSRYRRVYASNYEDNFTLFRNKMRVYTFLIPFYIRNRDYRLDYGYEWDMAQGGYKDEFWDKNAILGIPVGVVSLLNFINNTVANKLYFEHMSFLPMVSALHINPNVWQYNNLFYNLKTQGLMYNEFNSLQQSNTYGYPNLGHPSNHFDITPFEAIYCDNQTYEHIKMQATINDNPLLNNVFLVHTRNFLINEVESDVVYLQNLTIGKNHRQNDPNFKYRAWYKAYTRIEIGNLVSPKTDPGDYVIESTGDITVYAGESIIVKPGFHAQNGSTFHAFIKQECAQPTPNVPVYTSSINDLAHPYESILALEEQAPKKMNYLVNFRMILTK